MAQKRVGSELDNAVTKLVSAGPGTRTDVNMGQEIDSGEETVEYNAPLPNPVPFMAAPAPAPAAPPAVQLFSQLYGPDYFAQRAAYDARVATARANSMGLAANMPGGAGAYTTALVNRGQRIIVRARPLPIESDPVVQQLALQKADVIAKLNALTPVLTAKQNQLIKRRLENITRVQKGKKKGDEKTPSSDALQKLLFRALEMHASRRAAQLGAQARRARKERHALMSHQRGVALPDGTTVGLSRRYYKKRATGDIQTQANIEAKAEKKKLRLQLTKINKDRRVLIAQKHNRKVNPKDLKEPVQ